MNIDYKFINYKDDFYKIFVYHTNDLNISYTGHWHRSIEFSYVIDGTVEFNLNGSITNLKKKELILINSSEHHYVKYINNKNSNLYKMMTIFISYNFLKSEFPNIDNTKFILEYQSDLYYLIQKKLNKIFILFENNKNNSFNKIKMKSIVLSIIYDVLSKCKRSKVSCNLDTKLIDLKKYDNNGGYAKIAIEYITKNYKKDISIYKISKIVGLKPNYFCRYFKQETNYTFHQFLNIVRLQYALEHLKNSNSTVLESASIGGFPNVKSFIKVCKSVYGHTPKKLIDKF